MNKKIVALFTLLLIVLSFFQSCSVDIEGAPCDPEKNNCPSGQYCTSEGVCRYGSRDITINIRDAISDSTNIDTGEDAISGEIVEDILLSDREEIYDASEDTMDSGDISNDIEDIADTSDIIDIGDVEVTDILDGGCISECSSGEKRCISNNSLKECVLNNSSGCYEWSGEIFCNTPPDNYCKNNNTLIVYENSGICDNNQCKYNFKTIDCKYGCENGRCKDCTPDCKNKQCGDDGCGGSCGSCGDYAYCSNYSCSCYQPYGNCDNDWSNGCEIDLKNDVKNCGGCGNKCKEVSNATIKCEEMVCKIDSCINFYGDCDKKYDNGCETQLTTIYNCGDCGNDCTKLGWQNVYEYKCVPGSYKYRCDIGQCNIGYANCNNDPQDGCEVNTISNVNNCGACNHKCEVQNGTPECANGVCKIKSCNDGYKDCDQQYFNGCEVNIKTDPGNCGDCGKVCDKYSMHVVNAYCNQGYCDYDKCMVGWIDKDFNRSNGCETYDYFPKTYGTSNQEDPVGIVALNGGKDGYLIAGNSEGIPMFIRLDINGDIIWAKTISTSGALSIDIQYVTSETDRDGKHYFILAGSVGLSTSIDKDLFVMKIDDNGNLLWSFVFRTASDEYATSVLKISDGYIVLGYMIDQNDTDVILIKIDANGNYKWSYRYKNQSTGSNPLREIAYSIRPAINDGYIIAGSVMYSSGSDFLVLVVDSNGGLLNSRSIKGNNYNYGKKAFAYNNGYIYGGFTSSPIKSEEIALLYLNSDLSNASWSYTYGDNLYNNLIDLTLLTDGVLIAGQTASSTSDYNGILIKTSLTGDIIWQKSYGGSKRDNLVMALATPFDGGFIALGRSISFTNTYDLWVVKTDFRGDVIGDCPEGIPETLSFDKNSFSVNIIDHKLTGVGISPIPITIPAITLSDITVDTKMICGRPKN